MSSTSRVNSTTTTSSSHPSVGQLNTTTTNNHDEIPPSLIRDDLSAQRDPQQRDVMQAGGSSSLWLNTMFSQNTTNTTNIVTPTVQLVQPSSQRKSNPASQIMARVQQRNNGQGSDCSSSLNLNLQNTNTQQTGSGTRRGMNNVPKQTFEIGEDEQVRLVQGLHVGDFVRIEYSSGSDESDPWHKAEAFVGAKDQDGRLSLTLQQALKQGNVRRETWRRGLARVRFDVCRDRIETPVV